MKENVIVMTVILSMICLSCIMAMIVIKKAKSSEDTKGYICMVLANSIFSAEGGFSAKYPYGVKKWGAFLPDDHAREECERIIGEEWERFVGKERVEFGDVPMDFIDMLGERYCPADKRNWTNNVKWFLKHREPLYNGA